MSNEFYTNDYLRKLLLERPYVRARIENPGGSIIMTGVAADTEQPQEYSSQIGSSFHLDLVEAEVKFKELPREQQEALYAWSQGVSPKEASMYFSAKGAVLRKRRERGVAALTEKMNDDGTPESTADTRGTSRRDTSPGSQKYRRVT